MLQIAEILSKRATCSKRQVGCVLVDEYNRIIGTGYNGVPAGYPHCIETPCPGVGQPRGSDTCYAVHAEQNALLTCHDPYKIEKCYTTTAPCLRCTKMLMNTSCKELLFLENLDIEPLAKALWTGTGRHWTPMQQT